MSRIGKKPIAVPSGVEVQVDGQKVKVKGPKGELSYAVNDEVAVSMENGAVSVTPRQTTKGARSKWGLERTMIANLFQGVSQGFEKRLEISGVGYRASMQGKNLQLALGYSHDVIYNVPSGIAVAVPKPTEIVVSGIDKQRVGQVASEIRSYRAPEPYKGKGISYANETIVRKEGKKK